MVNEHRWGHFGFVSAKLRCKVSKPFRVLRHHCNHFFAHKSNKKVWEGNVEESKQPALIASPFKFGNCRLILSVYCIKRKNKIKIIQIRLYGNEPAVDTT